MALVTKGRTFVSGEVVTPTKLNTLVDSATVTQIVDADVSATAGIVDTKLATISTAGKVANSATTATSANTASAIVARDASGNFSAGTITASLSGNATTATSANAIADGVVSTTAKIANGIVTAAKLGATEQKQISKAWVRFSSTGVVLSSFNVSSVVRNSVGNYTVNFSAALPDANYAVSVTTANSIVMGAAITSTTSSVRVTAARVDTYSGFDSECFVIVFGN
jgi:hypothetical protein